MVETELSFNINIEKGNSVSSYSKIETQENYLIDPQDIKLGIYSKDIKDINTNTKEELLPISIERSKNYLYKKIGNCYTFFGDLYGDPKLIIGPHWPFSVFVIVFFSGGIFYFYKTFEQYIRLFDIILGTILYLFFYITFIYTKI